MGTRNLTIVYLEGNYRLAQYCQWDGYPTGQGATVLEFLQNLTPEKLELFKTKLKELPIRDEIYIRNLYENFRRGTFMTLEESEDFELKYPEYHRDTGANILNLILNQKIDGLKLSLDFAADSLFCEWAYLIDLDNKVLKVYRGFNKTPLTETDTFYFLQEKTVKSDYKPIKLIMSYSFNKLPSTPEVIELDCAMKEKELE